MVVAALEQTVARELSRFRRSRSPTRSTPRACPTRQTRCLVDHYRDAGVQLIVLGRLRRDLLEYDVYATWLRGRAFDGSARRRRRRRGHAAPPSRRPRAADRAARRARRSAAAAAVDAAVGCLTAIAARRRCASARVRVDPDRAPPPWSRFRRCSCAPARRRQRAAQARRARVVEVVGARSSRSSRSSLIADQPRATCASRAGSTGDLPLAVVAGVLWGAFVLLNGSWVLSPLHGLGQARHDAIWPLLQSWLALVFLRACAARALRAVLLAGAARLRRARPRRAARRSPPRCPPSASSSTSGCSRSSTIWRRYLDVQLVAGRAERAIRGTRPSSATFAATCAATASSVDASLFERTLFLPSALPDVVSYGGGFARPRILVGEQVRDAALGQLPDESELPDRTVNAEELPFGFIVPAPAVRWRTPRGERAPPARSRSRRLVRARMRRASSARTRRCSAGSCRSRATTASRSSPTATRITRSSSASLTEHYAAFERNVDDDEIDDTDPTQKDFLFGALLREIGVTLRLTATLAVWR